MDNQEMSISSWVTGNPLTVRSTDTLRSAVHVMADNKIGAMLITDDRDRLVGVFSERDLLQILAKDPESFLDQPIADFMTPDPICSQQDEDYNSVFRKMKTYNVRHIPVLDGEELVGIVSIRDLTRFYQHTLETEFVEAQRKIEELEKLTELREDDRLKTLVQEINRYKQLSLTDPLTGLYNKRYFSARLEEETARARRYGQSLSLIFCDVDHFKAVNDILGHEAGDRVLVQISKLLSGGLDRLNVVSRLRKSDIVARYGGEEFVAILPETPVAGAARAAENVRQAVESHVFGLDGEDWTVTMSFGVAQSNPDIEKATTLIKHADYALYQAKQNGRNRVEIYQP